MKVLLLGGNSNNAIERYYVKYLTALGVEINHFASPDIIFDFHSKNIINKVLFHSKIYTGYKAVNKKIIEQAYNYRPDIIWVFKGMEIFPETLAKLKNDFKLANFNPDHPFVIIAKGSGNSNVSNSVPHYHLHFCYHNELMERIKKEFNIPTVFLPFAYESTEVVYQNQQEIEEINKVCLQANPDAYRVNVLEYFTQNGFYVDVYGIGWDKTRLKKNKKINLYPIAPREQFWKFNQQYRIQLNLFREYNYGSHNMRTFEIPAVGGIELAPYSEEQTLFFEENKEIFFFRNDFEMIEKAKAIFEFSTEQVNTIRAASRLRSLTSGYTFKDRSKTVFETFKQMMQW